MTLVESIFCPGCGEEIFEVDYDQMPSEWPGGKACPNHCGWIEIGVEGEAVTVSMSPCTY